MSHRVYLHHFLASDSSTTYAVLCAHPIHTYIFRLRGDCFNRRVSKAYAIAFAPTMLSISPFTSSLEESLYVQLNSSYLLSKSSSRPRYSSSPRQSEIIHNPQSKNVYSNSIPSVEAYIQFVQATHSDNKVHRSFRQVTETLGIVTTRLYS